MMYDQYRHSVKSNEDLARKISHSIFVTNFPDSTSSRDLWKACSIYGTVVDVFIPNKKSQAGKRFAFVRFIKMFSLDRLVKNLCTIWFGSHHLFANQVRFERPPKSFPSALNGQSKNHDKANVASRQRQTYGPTGSYVNVVNGVFPSVVMGVKDVNLIPNLPTLLYDEGFMYVHLKYLGGLWVLFEFEKEETKILLAKSVSCGWIKREFRFMLGLSKPFLVLEGNGELLNIEDTSISSFGRKRVCILTKSPASILESFKIIVKGKVFMVRAKELFTWNTNFLIIKETSCSSDDESVQGEDPNNKNSILSEKEEGEPLEW
nr:RNA-directed DNA polymerase, eukaryota, nucleotide-binding alpha-beta plait domain protein [Tanacetum cinerariifolium]